MVKITIVIPVYNVENYLRQCLDSVINQTYKNLEIICVDDCSTDNSPQILQEYAQKDDRIKLIFNEKNSGPGLSRNKGIEIATGDYIHFLDSDDWMEPDAYEKLTGIINKNPEIDVLQFGLRYFSNIDNKILNTDIVADNFVNQIFKIRNNEKFIYSLTNSSADKLFLVKFIKENNLRYSTLSCFEDRIFGLQALVMNAGVLFCNDVFYNYRKLNSKSITGNYEKYLDYLLEYYFKANSLLNDLSQNTKDKMSLYIFANYFDFLLFLYGEKRISYKIVKDYLYKIDYSLYTNLKVGKLSHAQEILKYPEFIFNLKNNLRNFVKEKLPELFKLILVMKGKK